MLVIDTFADWAQFGPDQENDSGAASEAMVPVQNAAERGLAVLMSRHDRKAGGELGESARGSSAVAGKADILVSIRRTDGAGHERRRVLVAVGRFDDTPEQLVIELNKDDVYVALGDAQDIERTEAKAKALDLLPTSAPGFSLDELFKLCPGMAKSTLRRGLEDLVAAGKIIAAKGAGPSKRAMGYFCVSDNPSPENISTPRTGEMFSPSSLDGGLGEFECSPPSIREHSNIPPYIGDRGEMFSGGCQDCEDSPIAFEADSGRGLCRQHAPEGTWLEDDE
jgi:hypothetical protein